MSGPAGVCSIRGLSQLAAALDVADRVEPLDQPFDPGNASRTVA
jgi:hypothetical protein